MLKTLPKRRFTENKDCEPKAEVLNAILNFSRSLEVKTVKDKKVFIINN